MDNSSVYIPTYTGKKLHFLDPKPDEICVKDIAHSLARLPRYLGHTKHVITVAEHTVRMAWFLSHTPHIKPRTLRYCLLHDAPEAYLGEWPKPLKESVIGSNIRKAEKILLNAILRKYDAVLTSDGQENWVEMVDKGIVHAETELSGNMPGSLLPIKLDNSSKVLGSQIYESLTREFGWTYYGWTSSTAECRLEELFQMHGIKD